MFRRIDRHGHIGPRAVISQSVAGILKDRVEIAGLDPDAFSGHSLRAGLATSAAANGASDLTIMSVTGHASLTTLRKYVRRARLMKGHAANVAGL